MDVDERRGVSANKPDIPKEPTVMFAGILDYLVEIGEWLEQTQHLLDFPGYRGCICGSLWRGMLGFWFTFLWRVILFVIHGRLDVSFLERRPPRMGTF